MNSPTGLITVRLDVPDTARDEFTDWYNLEHVPQLTAMPGFTGTRRYFCGQLDIRYLAWYETTDEAVEGGPHFQGVVADPTPWSLRMRRHYGEKRERMNFKLMCEALNVSSAENTGPVVDAPWMYMVHTDVPDDIVDEYNAWYDKEHLPRCANIPGVLRARRYTAQACTSGTVAPRYLTVYEMTGEGVWESPAAKLARQTPWTEKMRSLFTNTRRALYQLIAPTVTHDAARRLVRT